MKSIIIILTGNNNNKRLLYNIDLRWRHQRLIYIVYFGFDVVFNRNNRTNICIYDVTDIGHLLDDLFLPSVGCDNLCR